MTRSTGAGILANPATRIPLEPTSNSKTATNRFHSCLEFISPTPVRRPACSPPTLGAHLQDSRRKPSESAWLNSPIASIEALLSEYIWCGTSRRRREVDVPLVQVHRDRAGHQLHDRRSALREPCAMPGRTRSPGRSAWPGTATAGRTIRVPRRSSDELQQIRIRASEQFHARGLVHAARLHADEAVLDQVRSDADAVAARRSGWHALIASNAVTFLPFNRDGPALLEANRHRFRLVRRILWQDPHARRDEPRAGFQRFELAGLVRQNRANWRRSNMARPCSP